MSKTILITGATSGIGTAVAKIFAEHNYDIIITGRRADRLDQIKKEISDVCKGGVTTLCFDVRDKGQVATAIASLADTGIEIDILVNNAGLALGLSTIDEGSTEDWETMIDTNVKGLLYVTRQVAPLMKERASGHIINIGSVAGQQVYKNGNVYCATKYAVDALTQGMRIDLLNYGIKVTAVNPGMVETEFSLVRFKGDEARAGSVYNDVNALTAKDIADIVFYCASQPPHVCINDITVTPLTQANVCYSIKEADRIKA
jgi:NADP-dependent 3-hydroxy acid dehydrogenase YdfG